MFASAEEKEAAIRKNAKEATLEKLDEESRSLDSVAPIVDKRDDFTKRIDAINEAFAAQLKRVDDAIANASDDLAFRQELTKRRGALVARRRDALGAVEEERAEVARSKDERLAETIRATIEKFGTPFEKIAVAEEGVRNAMDALVVAQESQDSNRIADALARLGEAQDKYSGLTEAQNSLSRASKASAAPLTHGKRLA